MNPCLIYILPIFSFNGYLSASQDGGGGGGVSCGDGGDSGDDGGGSGHVLYATDLLPSRWLTTLKRPLTPAKLPLLDDGYR